MFIKYIFLTITASLLISFLYTTTQTLILNNFEKRFNSGLASAPDEKNLTNLETLTIERIFDHDHSRMRDLPDENMRVMMATGDVLLARTVNYKNVQSGNFLWPFEKTADVLRSADIAYINLETPLINDCQPTNSGMIFCGDSRNVESLIFAGIDVVNIANNHMGNYGSEGAEETSSLLTKNNMLVSGFRGPVYKNVDGLTFAFLGYNEVGYQEGVSSADEGRIKGEIAQAHTRSDVVVVQFHWGNEYTTEISPGQKKLAYLAVDSGADLVLGNHPHWIQPVEIYKDKVIAYSHGNFIFDQEWSQKTKEGVVGLYIFYDSQLIDVEYLPVLIEDYGQPHFLTGEQKYNILDEMKTESMRLRGESL